MESNSYPSKGLMQEQAATILNKMELDENLKTAILEACCALDELLLTHQEAASLLAETLDSIAMEGENPLVTINIIDLVSTVMSGMRVATVNLVIASNSASQSLQANCYKSR